MVRPVAHKMNDQVLAAYARVQDNEYMEVFGLDFEQFEVGQVFRHRPGITISAQDNTDESLDTQNAAQIHYDANYAAKTEFKRPLGVSTLTLQKCFGMAWKTFARKDRIVSFSSIEMKNPVFAGATLYAESEILARENGDQHCGLVTVRAKALDEFGTVLTSVDYQIRIYKQGQHPYYGSLDADFNLVDERFAAFRQEKDSILVEQTGLYFEEFEIGETFHHRPEKFIDNAEALEHARRSLDWNPRFTNPTFAQEYFTEKVAPLTEIYAIGALTASTTRTLGRVVANLAWKNVTLSRLVYPGASFQTHTTVTDKRESRSRPDQGILTVTSTARDADGQTVLTYDRVLLVYRKNRGPYADSGY